MDTPRGDAKLFEHFANFRNHTVAVVPNNTEIQVNASANCIEILKIRFDYLKEFLKEVNDLWLSMGSTQRRNPINWLLFPTSEELLTAYWMQPEDIIVAAIFEEPGPITGPLK